MEVISQEFNGVIPRVRIDHVNGDDRINTIVDWATIKNKHQPLMGDSPQYRFVLEYLTASYYLPSLLKIPGSAYPEFKASDRELQRAVKTIEFKRKFGPAENYAIQFLLWNYGNDGYGDYHFDRDYLYNGGVEGRIDLIKPYLVTKGDTIFGDINHKLGMSIIPNFLKPGDYIEISGGYSGAVSYLYKEPEIDLVLGAEGYTEISTSPTLILFNQNKRASLFLSNCGTKRIYWRFGHNSELIAGTSPFLEPGESLTIEHGKLYSPSNNEHLILKNQIKSISKLPLYVVTESGIGKVSFQELRFP